MSSVPPEPPAPPPPPLPPMAPPPGPPPVAGSGVIPWEERERYGFFEALIETVKLFVTEPRLAWSRTPPKGKGVGDPLIFAIIVSWVGAVFGALYGLFFKAPWLAMLPEEFRSKMGGSVPGHVAGMIGQIIIAPLIIAIGLFIGCALLHLCLMLVGGLSNSSAGFDGTFRAVAYSSPADLANLIPFVGGFVAGIWKLVLVVMGLVELHKTTTGKAIAAVLIPLVFCCGCVIAATTLFVGAIAGLMNR